jgi:hypothetical protein
MSNGTGCGCGCAGFGDCASSLTLDPFKRVSYAEGLVLGVDEFVQEEYYFLEAARRHHRNLHGYGTVCGLAVTARDVSGGVEVRVAPGQAIDQMGREIRVRTAQCARLDGWLSDKYQGSPPLALTSPPLVDVWVVLCYRECLTDLEPIPGGPCRTPEESMTATRVSETFSLRLELKAPNSPALDAIRSFAGLINLLDPVVLGTADISIAQFEAEVAALADMASPPSSPPSSPPVPLASPPGGPWQVPEDQIEAYLRAAFRTWVTIVRPALVPEGRNCADGPGGEGCIPLARLSVPVALAGAGLAVDGGAAAIEVLDADRPLLLSTQLLQELLVNGGATGTGTSLTEHNQLLGLQDDDHLQYLLIAPRSGAPGAPDLLLNNLSAANSVRLRQLPAAAAAGDAMPSGQPAGGDLSGTLPNPTVKGLQGLALPVPGSAQIGQHLALGGSVGNLAWQLVSPPVIPPGSSGEERLVRLMGLSWMHNAAHDLRFRLIDTTGQASTVTGLAIGFGIKEPNDAEVILGIDPGKRYDLGSLDIHSFRVYAEVPNDLIPNCAQRLRLLPDALIPIRPDLISGESFFTAGQQLTDSAAPGALLLFNEDTVNQLLERQALVWIEIDGDHVLGREAGGNKTRAVDTEFLRSRLPSGDRPEGAERGTQGGLFSSWINRADPNGLRKGRVDLNRADAAVLRAVGLTELQAGRVIKARHSAGGFASLDEIGAIPQISAAAANRLTNDDQFFLGAR